MNERLMLEVDCKEFKSKIIDSEHLSGEWVRNSKREQNLYKDGDLELYCFDYLGKEFTQSTISFRSEGDSVKVSNIGPKPVGSLNIFEWNALLTNFIAKNLVSISHTLSIIN